MPIYKLFINGRRFIGKIESGTGTGDTFAIAATSFTNDTGSTSPFPNSYAYYNLYINGILQTTDVSTITVGPSSITIPNGNELDPSTPVILEFIVT